MIDLSKFKEGIKDFIKKEAIGHLESFLSDKKKEILSNLKKDILYIDMDGCIADFDKAILKYGLDLHDEKHDESYLRNKVDEICEANYNIFQELEVIKGSQRAVYLLNEKYDIYFLSTPMHNVSHSYMDKKLWLEKNFPEVSHKKLILTHNKGLNAGKYLIDDRIKNGVEDFQGEHIHFGTSKFPDWDAVLKYLL